VRLASGGVRARSRPRRSRQHTERTCHSEKPQNGRTIHRRSARVPVGAETREPSRQSYLKRLSSPGFSLSNGVLRAVYRWVNSLRRFRRSKLSEPRCCDLELPCAKVFMRHVTSSPLTISGLPDLGRGGRGELALIGREVAGAAWAPNANLRVASREALDRGQVLAHPRSCTEGPRNFFLESEVSPFQAPNRRRIVAIKASPSGS